MKVKTTRKSTIAVLVVGLFSNLATAAAPVPDAGSIERDISPAFVPLPKNNVTLPEVSEVGVKSTDVTPITVKSIRVTGATIFSAESLEALVADAAMGTRTLGELRNAARRITLHYRRSGYFLVLAYLPAQKMEDGQVTIAVLEGKLAEVQVQNTSRLSNETLKARLAGLTPGMVMQRAPVDRALLLLGDVPGVGGVDSRLAPGSNTGETVLVAVVKPAPVWTGRLEADNFGSLYSGRYRLGASVEGNSPLGHGERLSASILASDANLAYGRAAVQVPVGSGGMTLGAGFTHSQYSLADIYKSLDAVGQSDALEANVRYPLVRSVPFNLYGLASLEQRKLRDEIRATSTQTDKEASVVSLALQADWRDSLGGRGANSQAGITLTAGHLDITSATAAAIDAIAANTVGGYSKVGISFSRQQGLTNKLSLTTQLRGQWADKNLDSSEKLSLGGASGVRAYPSGEASGDGGWLGSLELQYAVVPKMAASVFYDAGSVSVNTKPYLATPNKRQLSGAGIGLAGSYEAFDWRMTLAWRNRDASTSEPDKTPRFWAQAAWRF